MMTNGWQTVPLGKFLAQRKEFFIIDDFSNYKRARVQSHGQGIVLRDEIDGTEIKTKKQQAARTGEFLVAEIDAKVGGFGIVPPELDGAVVSSHYFLFQIDESKCSKEWLNWFVRYNSLEDQTKAQGSTNYAAIRPNDVLNFEIPLPPLTEQRRIVEDIELLAARVNEAQRLREEAEIEAEALWYSNLSKIFQRENNSQLPTLEEVCNAIIDNLHATPRYDGSDFPCVRSQDIGWGTVNYSTALRVSEQEFNERIIRGEPQAGDIVFVREGDVGRCAVVDGSQRFCLGQRVMMLRPNPKIIEAKFLMYQLISSPVLNNQLLEGMTGTTSRHLNISRFRKVRFLVPPLDEQRRIVAFLDSLQAKVNTLQKLQSASGEELSALMPSVLDKAFKGEL